MKYQPRQAMRGSSEIIDDVSGTELLSNVEERRGRNHPESAPCGAKVTKEDGDYRATGVRMSPYLDPSPAGPSTQRSELPRPADFLPPMRPKSTPFSYPDQRDHKTYCIDDCDSWESASDINPNDDDDTESGATLFESIDRPASITQLSDLPVEVHEAILDHIFGFRVSATSSSSMKVTTSTARNWSSVQRHCRRRELTELALVSPTWRDLIQQRLYKHIKLKATVDYLEEAMLHFTENQHLKGYVTHLEIWFPVFQPTYAPWTMFNALTLPTVTTDGLTNATYTLPGNNCTLEQVFLCAQQTWPRIRILTLEGGERRKAPKVVHFAHQDIDPMAPGTLPTLESVQTLITRGQWNLMRDNRDFDTIFAACPGLTRWHGSYSKPKSKSYISISEFLPTLDLNVTHLNLCLESDYRREPALPHFFFKALQKKHLCVHMAATLPRLEHFSYTGRVCHSFFDTARKIADPRVTRLTSIDLTVKNCCRHEEEWHDSGSGIQDMAFIQAFERLVIAAIRSLEVFKQVQYIRIRFVDLDSVLPPLNPYFILQNDRCSGVWSNEILEELHRVRPSASFVELNPSFGHVVYNKEGRMVLTQDRPGMRIQSLCIANYLALSNRITIQ